jgi:hypothetical protein
MSELMTNEELDALAKRIPTIKAWVAAVEKEIQKAIEEGHEFENVRIVPTRPTRMWRDDVDPIKVLRKFLKLDLAAPRKALTPAQAEEALGKKAFKEKVAEFVTSKSSGTKLDYPKH